MPPNSTTQNITNTALLTAGIALVQTIPSFLNTHDYIAAGIVSIVAIAVIYLYSVLP